MSNTIVGKEQERCWPFTTLRIRLSIFVKAQAQNLSCSDNGKVFILFYGKICILWF